MRGQRPQANLVVVLLRVNRANFDWNVVAATLQSPQRVGCLNSERNRALVRLYRAALPSSCDSSRRSTASCDHSSSFSRPPLISTMAHQSSGPLPLSDIIGLPNPPPITTGGDAGGSPGFERYEKIQKLGEGTYGVVYKAKDRLRNCFVALKKVRMDAWEEGVPATALREISALKELAHPHIVQLFDVFVSFSGNLYLVFELLDRDLKAALDNVRHKNNLLAQQEVAAKQASGEEIDEESIARRYKRSGLHPTLVRSYLWQLLSAVEACHSHRLYHRDLKPQNILLGTPYWQHSPQIVAMADKEAAASAAATVAAGSSSASPSSSSGGFKGVGGERAMERLERLISTHADILSGKETEIALPPDTSCAGLEEGAGGILGNESDPTPGTLKLADFGLARTFSLPLRAYTHEVSRSPVDPVTRKSGDQSLSKAPVLICYLLCLACSLYLYLSLFLSFSPSLLQIVTLWYRCPEILLGQGVYSAAVDIWSAGAIFGEMSCGHPLFTGDSEIDQIYKTFAVLGTPTKEEWPLLVSLPDYSESFPKWPKRSWDRVVPHLCEPGRDLLARMLKYDPNERITATEALSHPYFAPLQAAVSLAAAHQAAHETSLFSSGLPSPASAAGDASAPSSPPATGAAAPGPSWGSNPYARQNNAAPAAATAASNNAMQES